MSLLQVPGSENESEVPKHPDRLYTLWTEEEVGDWLKFHGLDNCIRYFEPHSIDGEVLPFLTAELLIEMGIDDEDIRASILTRIDEEKVRGRVKQQRRNTQSQMKSLAGQNSIVHLYQGETTQPSEAAESGANVNRYGFIEEGDEEQTEELRRKLIQRENERLKKWKKMSQTKGENFKMDLSYEVLKKNPKFKKRLSKGIPDAWRLMVWKWMSIGEGQEKYDEISKIYKGCLEKTTKFDDENQIDLDINRTLRNHVEYKQRYGPGQKRLFNVLRAFANHVPEIGFCQGMATVAAFLLMYSDEETAFGMMLQLANPDKYGLKGLWQSGFPLLMEAFFIHNRLFKYHLPRLWKHFNNQKIHPSAYATRWYMTLFLSFSFQTSLRVWDMFLNGGFEVLLFFSIAVLEYYQAELIKMEFEGIMDLLGQLSRKTLDDEKLVELQTKISHKTLNSMPGKAKALQKLREEYYQALADGKPPMD